MISLNRCNQFENREDLIDTLAEQSLSSYSMPETKKAVKKVIRTFLWEIDDLYNDHEKIQELADAQETLEKIKNDDWVALEALDKKYEKKKLVGLITRLHLYKRYEFYDTYIDHWRDDPPEHYYDEGIVHSDLDLNHHNIDDVEKVIMEYSSNF